MDRLPWLRVPPGEGKGRQRERIPRNDAARHGPKSRTGRGWRNLPGAPREGQGASTAFPAGPGNSREEPGLRNSVPVTNTPLTPRYSSDLRTVGKTPGAPLPEPRRAFQPGIRTGSRGRITPMPGAARRDGRGHFWGFPVPEGQREWPGWALIPPERGARCHGERLGWRWRLLSPSPAQPSPAAINIHRASGERRRAAQSLSERWEEPREEPGIRPASPASTGTRNQRRGKLGAAGSRGTRGAKLHPGTEPRALLPRGHASPTSPSPGFAHFHPFPAETRPGKIPPGREV